LSYRSKCRFCGSSEIHRSHRRGFRHRTLALSSDGMPLSRLWPLLGWARSEIRLRRTTARELLNYLRDKICKQVLDTPK
jgi:hypothetical protein